MDKRARIAAPRAGRAWTCVALGVFVRRDALQRQPQSVLGQHVLQSIREQDGGRLADAGRNRRAAGARGARSRGDADRIRRPQAATGGRLGCRLDGRRRLAGRGRRRRDAGFAFEPLRRACRRASFRQWSCQRRRGQERDAHRRAGLSRRWPRRCERRDGKGAQRREGRRRRRHGQGEEGKGKIKRPRQGRQAGRGREVGVEERRGRLGRTGEARGDEDAD